MTVNIVHADGQTCNKFWAWANFMAEAYAKKQKITVLTPDIVIREYPNLQSNNTIKFPFYSQRIAKSAYYKRYIRFLQFAFANKYSIVIQKGLFGLIPGVKFYDLKSGAFKSKLKQAYFDRLKSDFTPSNEIVNDCNLFFESLKAKSTIVLGLHIRYGDYRTFKGGKYYYSLLQYREKIEAFQRIFPNDKISVFISTNEKLDKEVFNGLDINLLSGGATHDLYTLSLCDYIIGPPSTFSGWAAFMGDKRIYFIEDAADEIAFRKITQIWDE